MDDETDVISVGPYLEILEDRDGKLTFSEIHFTKTEKHFQQNHLNTPNFGYTDTVYWLRFSAMDRSERKEEWFLEIGYPLIDKITFFYPDDAGYYKQIETGDVYPFYDRTIQHTNFVLRLPLTEKEKAFYLRFESKSTMQFPLKIYSSVAFMESDHQNQIFMGIYYGIMLAMICYNLFLFIGLRDNNYLFYVLYIVGYSLFQLTFNGLAFEYFWPAYPNWSNQATPFFVSFALVWIIVFSKSFLVLRDHTPVINRFLNVLIGLSLLNMILTFFISYAFCVRFSTAVAFVALATIIFSGINVFLKKYRPARFFLIAWTILLFGICISILRGFGLLPGNFLTLYGMQVGSALEVILLSLALADRMNILKKQYSDYLLNKVTERTEELHGKTRKLLKEISTREQTEKSLKESEDKYRILVENSLIGIGITKGNQIVFVNNTLADLLGYDDVDELVKIPFLDTVAPENRALVRQRMKNRESGRRIENEVENRFV